VLLALVQSKYRVFAHQQTAQQVKALLDAKADPNVKYGVRIARCSVCYGGGSLRSVPTRHCAARHRTRRPCTRW